MSSPTQRTTRVLRDAGQLYDIVETFNHMTCRRKDMLGFIDIVTFDAEGKMVGLQVTGGGNGSARVKKITQERTAQALAWLRAGCLIEVHDWRKVAKKRGGKQKVWACRVIPVTFSDFEGEAKYGGLWL